MTWPNAQPSVPNDCSYDHSNSKTSTTCSTTPPIPNGRGFCRLRPIHIRDAEAFVARQILKNWDEKPRFAIEFNGTVVGSVKLTIEARIR